MDTITAKATLSDLETRLDAAMQKKLDKACGEHGPIPTVTHCPECGGYVPFDHTTEHYSLGGSTVGIGCIVEVAADRNALVDALAEYGFRLVLEGTADWSSQVTRLVIEAKDKTAQKIVDEIKSKQGAVCR